MPIAVFISVQDLQFFFRNITVTVIGLLRAELSIHSREDTFLLALCPQKEY